MSSHVVTVNGIDICHELHGPEDGDRVLLISGTGADLRSDPARDRHPLVRAGFRVLMYDQRGLGRTSKPEGPYSMEGYADDAAALLDAVGWPSAHVVGISFGGMVAQHVVLRHPGRVRRLVLACTSSGGAGGSSFDLLAIADLPPAERERIALSVMDSRNDFSTHPPTIAPGLGPWLAAAATALARRTDPPGDPAGKAASDPTDPTDPTAAAAEAAAAAAAARGARLQLEARAHHDTWDRLAGVSHPTLVIGGRYDRQAPPENLERLTHRLPDARLVLCDGGHLFMIQDPTAWPTITAFLGEPPTANL